MGAREDEGGRSERLHRRVFNTGGPMCTHWAYSTVQLNISADAAAREVAMLSPGNAN